MGKVGGEFAFQNKKVFVLLHVVDVVVARLDISFFFLGGGCRWGFDEILGDFKILGCLVEHFFLVG